MKRRVSLDAVYAFTGPRDVSGQDQYVTGLKNYMAEYRMNSGYWTMVRKFRAVDDAAAKAHALSVIPERKPKDKTYMIVHKLWCVDDADPQEQP